MKILVVVILLSFWKRSSSCCAIWIPRSRCWRPAMGSRQSIRRSCTLTSLSFCWIWLCRTSTGSSSLRNFVSSSPDVPVVVLSASEDRDSVMRAINDGAMGFIPKTSRTEVLIAALRLVFSGGVYLLLSAFGGNPVHPRKRVCRRQPCARRERPDLPSARPRCSRCSCRASPTS